MKIAVIGLGKLGLPLSLVFAKSGFEVYGIDSNEERIREIKAYQSVGFPEPKLTEYLQMHTVNLDTAIRNQLEDIPIVFVIVQTPSLLDGHFDVSYVSDAVQGIHEVNSNALIVVSSNLNIGTIDKLSGVHKRICYNPEFVALGSIVRGFENPKFVIVGAYTKEDGEQVASIWRKVHNRPVHIVKPIEAEIIKLTANFSFALGITFANVIGELCEKIHADPNVLNIIYKDRRDYKPGLGFAGPCFPRDVNCLKAMSIRWSAQSGRLFAETLNELNIYTIERYIRKIKSFGKKKVAIFGIAYKPDVPYVYESQSLEITKRLLDEGYEVYIYDPLAEESARQVLKCRFCSTVEECLNEAEVIFIGTSNYSGIKSEKHIVDPWMTR